MKTTINRVNHRAPSTAHRNGAAALIIGGLVAGTVATAGAATLSQKPAVGDVVATGLTEDIADADRGVARSADGTDVSAAENVVQAATLRSTSLSELRDLRAAGRSEARSAPEDLPSAPTLLTDGFTGQTIEVQVEEPEPAAQEEPAPSESEEQAAIEQAAAEQAAADQAAQEQAAAEQAAAEQAAADQAAQEQAAADRAAQPQTQREQPRQQPTQQQTQRQVQPSAPAPAGGSVIEIAASYVGSPYVLYGTPPSSFDCSAYTWWVFKQAGIDIPRTVSAQKSAVTPVSTPQPGDLVFYNDYYHVGIYAGNGMTYEALNPSTGVRYGPMISNNVWYGRVG